MRRRRIVLALLCVAPVLPAAAQSRPELIKNGDFAQGLEDWTANGHVDAAHDRDYDPKNHSPAATFATFNRGDTTPNAVLSQAVETEPKADYLLTFSFAAYDASGGSHQILDVTIVSNGEVLAGKTIGPVGGSRDLSKIFRRYQVPFTAYGPSVTITFTDRSADTKSVDGLLTEVSVKRR